MRALLSCTLALWLAACGSSAPGSTAPDARVLIIGLDGTRSELLEIAAMPQLSQFRARGVTDLDAITGDVSLSGPGWASLLSGVWCDKHGVVDNDVSWANSRFDRYPHFLTRVEQARPELHTVSVSHWAPINDEILCADERADDCGAVDTVITQTSDAGVRDAVVQLLRQGDPDVVFVQFDDIDHAGHGTEPYQTTAGGFCPRDSGSLDGACTVSGLNSEYLRAAQVTDGYLGDIFTALYQRPGFSAENWVIMLSPDHGGAGTLQNQHGFNTAQERRTFFILSAARTTPLPGQAVTTLAGLPDASGNSRPPVDVTGVKIVDVAATALFHLGIAIDPQWGLDGQPVGLPGVPLYVERPIASCYNPATFVPDQGRG